MNITAETDVAAPLRQVKKYSKQPLMQQQIAGTDVRLLVIGNKVISALERRPAAVIGDGVHSVHELILRDNEKPERGKLGIDTLVEISLSAVRQFLTDGELKAVPASGEAVRVVGPSNQSLGGTVHDIMSKLPSRVTHDALMLTTHLRMPIAGVDCIITPDGHHFLEINASPGIAIHDDPERGIVSGCFEAYMALLYKDEWWRL
jgi:cyanophycin synthetase